MDARAAALLAALLGALTSAGAPGSSCTISRCCGMLGGLGRYFHDEQTNFWSENSMFCSGSCEYSPACGLLNIFPGLEEEGGLCNSTSDDNATILDAISSDPTATSRLSSGRPLVSTFIEGGTCAELESGECWSVPAGFAAYEWTNELVGDSRDVKQCTRGHHASGQPSWGLGCAADGAGLRVLAWLSDANATDANASDRNAPLDRRTADAWAGEDWFADACGLSAGLDFSIRADDWNSGPAGSPRWRCFDIPHEHPGSDPMRMLVQSVGDLPCAGASNTTGAPAGSTTDPAPDSSDGVRSGATALAAAAAAVVVHHLA